MADKNVKAELNAEALEGVAGGATPNQQDDFIKKGKGDHTLPPFMPEGTVTVNKPPVDKKPVTVDITDDSNRIKC